MALNEYLDEKDIISQIRMYFDSDERWKIDFDSCLSKIEDFNELYYSLKIKNKSFVIHKITGVVMEVE